MTAALQVQAPDTAHRIARPAAFNRAVANFRMPGWEFVEITDNRPDSIYGRGYDGAVKYPRHAGSSLVGFEG